MIKKHRHFSILLLTHNEEKNLLKYWTWLDKAKRINEIVVVDDNSDDKTIEILKKLGSKKIKVKVFKRGLNNNFSNQRNFGITKTTNNWVLWLDADEKPSTDLIRFLNHIDNLQYKSYAFKRNDIFIGHELKHGENAHQHFVRFFNKKYGRFTGLVHEIWQTPKEIELKKIHIHHYPHQSLRGFIKKINFYSDIRAQELFDQNQKSNLFQIIFYPFGKFINDYFFKLGFLDGTPGIIMALGMSFHSFLVRSKLWHLSHH
ncbi:MAG TPA: glycosyltransferase family 2 protein [Candidatus Woesebacteria bacterium]|nr:glycosyltransferase family 2 protein [Candidatus Woesebacteria bacterium]